MTAELKPIRTAAETGLVEAFAALRPRLAGTAAAAPARGGVPPLRDGGPAASAHRGVEVHRPARADARRQAACRAPGCRRDRPRARGRRRARRYRRPPHRVRRRVAGAGALRSHARAGADDLLAARRARTRQPGGAGAPRGWPRGGRHRLCPQHRLHGRRRGHRRRARTPVRRGRCISSSTTDRAAPRPSSRARW